MVEKEASKRVEGGDERRSNGPAAAGSPFSTSGASTERGGYSAWVWLSLTCLDAPIVAVCWQWLFAQSFDLEVNTGEPWALFLTAWLIYLADRYADGTALNENGPRSLRQAFCRRHRGAWKLAIAVIAAADVVVIVTTLEAPTTSAGIILGALAVSYLVVNQVHRQVWMNIPFKEVVIGLVFAAGSILVFLPEALHIPDFRFAWVLFGLLCTLNCVTIALWEEDLDRVQARHSIATYFARLNRYLSAALVALGAIAIAAAFFRNAGGVVYLCIGASALLLGTLATIGGTIQRDIRVALADLVLLTPLIVMATEALSS
jgi:hypothetical protein